MRMSNRAASTAVCAAAVPAGIVILYLARHSPYLFAILFLLGLVLAVSAAVMFGGKMRDLAVVLATVCLVLLGVESVALVVDTSPLTLNQGRYTEDYIGFDPVLGAAPARAGTFDSKKIDKRTGEVLYDVSYTIDPHLIRRTQSPQSGPTVAFFGDSFMFGEGVQDSETLPQVFADLAGRAVRVLNFGFHGYGPQQFLRTLETGHFDALMRPGLRLAVFQTAPWHAERTSCAADFVAGSPRYVLKDGAAEFAGSCAGTVRNVLFKQFEKSAAYRLLVRPLLAGGPSRADVELYIAVIAKAVSEARTRYGIPTVVLYLGYNDRYLAPTGFGNEDIIARLRDAGARVVDVTLTDEEGNPLTRYDQPSPLILARDGHPTPLAQRRRAELLAAYLAGELPGALAAATP